MRTNIIEVTKDSMCYSCLICGKRDNVNKLKINRLHRDDNVITFCVCDECLNKMKDELGDVCND